MRFHAKSSVSVPLVKRKVNKILVHTHLAFHITILFYALSCALSSHSLTVFTLPHVHCVSLSSTVEVIASKLRFIWQSLCLIYKEKEAEVDQTDTDKMLKVICLIALGFGCAATTFLSPGTLYALCIANQKCFSVLKKIQNVFTNYRNLVLYSILSLYHQNYQLYQYRMLQTLNMYQEA